MHAMAADVDVRADVSAAEIPGVEERHLVAVEIGVSLVWFGLVWFGLVWFMQICL